MIIFRKLRWKNLLSTGNTFTELCLDKSPTTLVLGANGSGKSTMLDALCYGLFKKPFRKIKKDQIYNTINDGDCVVEVEFEIGTHTFKVSRGSGKCVSSPGDRAGGERKVCAAEAAGSLSRVCGCPQTSVLYWPASAAASRSGWARSQAASSGSSEDHVTLRPMAPNTACTRRFWCRNTLKSGTSPCPRSNFAR